MMHPVSRHFAKGALLGARLLLAALLLVLALPAGAQERRASHCIALAGDGDGPERLLHAALRAPPVRDTVRLNYLGHSMFWLQTAGGLNLVTDYNGALPPDGPAPQVATMNHAHSSHWTAMPDPRIAHLLRGWGDGRSPAEHHLDLGEMLVRNVPTDIRDPWNAGVEKYGNSIFVFEVAGLCIGHLGHLHHVPDSAQYAALGRIDVVMTPIDGSMTLPLPQMREVLARLRASVVVPMHWFGPASLEAFLAAMAPEFDIRRDQGSSVEIGLATLPSRPTVVVLDPEPRAAERD